jgi:pimeloyl-[acyl-carrier protein] synthase
MTPITDQNGRIKPEILTDPYSYYDELRATSPVHFEPSLGGWMLTRGSDVRDAVMHPQLSSERTQAYLSELPSVDRERFAKFVNARSDMLLFCDGEKHRRLRQTVVKALRSVDPEDFRALVGREVDGLIDVILEKGQVDLVADFSIALPISVLLQLLGIPAMDRGRVLAWATDFNLAIGGVIKPDRVRQAEKAVDQVSEYLDGLLDEKAADRTVLDHLQGESRAGKLSRDELHATCLMLITAGHETVSNLIGNSLIALMEHPIQMAWLHKNLGEVPNAINELVRFDAPVQLTAREAKAAVVIGGQEIRQGDRVIPMWGAANRDPAFFYEPGKLILDRPQPIRHFSFGAGRHRCVGAPLATTEASIALGHILSKAAQLRLIASPRWKENFSFRGPQELLAVVEAH